MLAERSNAEVGRAGGLADVEALEAYPLEYWPEEWCAAAQQQRHDVDHGLVNEAGCHRLLRGIGAEDADVARPPAS